MRYLTLFAAFFVSVACGSSTTAPEETPPTVEQMLAGRWVSLSEGGDYTLPHCIRECDNWAHWLLTGIVIRFDVAERTAIDSAFHISIEGHVDNPDSVPRFLATPVTWEAGRPQEFEMEVEGEVRSRWGLDIRRFDGGDTLFASGLLVDDTLFIHYSWRHTLPGLPGGNLRGRWVFVAE